MTEAISARLTFAGGWSNSLIPVAQFNPHERFDKPIMHAGAEGNAYKLWRERVDRPRQIKHSLILRRQFIAAAREI